MLGEKLDQKRPNPADAGKGWKELAELFVDEKESKERRTEAAVQLGRAVTALGQKKYKEATKLPACLQKSTSRSK